MSHLFLGTILTHPPHHSTETSARVQSSAHAEAFDALPPQYSEKGERPSL